MGARESPVIPPRSRPPDGLDQHDRTTTQVRLYFATKEEAIAYAEKAGLAFTLDEPKVRKQIRKSYADNFKFGRKGAWTH